MIKSKFLAVGVMSGTSMDGIDISLILSDGKKSYKHIKSKFYTYKQSTKTTLSKFVDLFTVSKHSLALLRIAEELVTFEYIAALKKFLKDENLSKIDLISLHGQTIFHDPINKLSIQLCDEVKIKDVFNLPIVSDFRQKDLSLGGQGAPLTPIFHKLLMLESKLTLPVCFVNIGGISNITVLDDQGHIYAYDTGPGMCLLDQYISRKKKINFDKSVSGLEVAEKISKSLSKQALLISVDGELKDLNHDISKDSTIKIFTSKDKEGLETIRHDTAHILAMAVQELFPRTQVTIGPVIEDGFYYDFARKEPFTTEDLEKIETKMKEIVDRDEKTYREVWKRDDAIEHFKKKGEIYKAEIIESIPEGEEVSLYFHGDWHDLCRGPHLSSTGRIGKYFKLTKVSGAYWRGDSNNEMLQRIYGTSWSTQKELDDYLNRIEEAEKRDHRKIGKEMDLFHFREESPGSVFWHQKGWSLFQKLISYMRMKQETAGYQEINTPEILDRSLWEKSGHWEKFGANMYTSTTPDEKVFAIKPMNCPGCVQVFNQGLKSYRDLPLKMSEFGKVHRYEPSGALHGLLRVRAFTQDDAHIFCTEEQITEECLTVTNLIL